MRRDAGLPLRSQRLPLRSQRANRAVSRTGGSRSFRPRFRQFVLFLLGATVVTFLVPFYLGSGIVLPAWLTGRSPWVATWPPSAAFCKKVRRAPPLVCAHGGESAFYPPNTLGAIKAVSETNARCIEIDASRTSDGVLVALHGRDLANILGQEGGAAVGDYSLAQLKALEVKGGQSILTLEEAITGAMSIGLDTITLDLKPAPPLGEKGFPEALLSVLDKAGCGDACQAWAKDDSLVHAVNEASSNLRTGYVVMNQTSSAKAEGLDIVVRMPQSPVMAVYYGMVDEHTVSAAKHAGKAVHTWTVNDPDAMKQVLEHAVDAIVTNHPREIQAAVDNLQIQCLSNP